MKNVSLYCLLLLIFFSCSQRKNKEEIARLLGEWQGKEILFPDNIIFTRYLTDTLDYQLPQSEYKMLIYVDSSGCTSCKLQLSRWKELKAYADSVTNFEIPFIFFIHSKDYAEILYLLRVSEYDSPVCIDINDELNKLNHFPSNSHFQTFLLNSENKVVMIGNPVHNVAIKQLFLKIINGEKNTANNDEMKTTASIDISNIDMGVFKKSETKKAIFSIKNTGDKPLIIADVATSCTCAEIKYEKQPAAPGSYLQLFVEMTPKDTGFFSETITVKCNAKGHLKLTIRGKTI